MNDTFDFAVFVGDGRVVSEGVGGRSGGGSGGGHYACVCVRVFALCICEEERQFLNTINNKKHVLP